MDEAKNGSSVYFDQQREWKKRLVKNKKVEKDKKFFHLFQKERNFWIFSEECPIFTKYIIAQPHIKVNNYFLFFGKKVLFFLGQRAGMPGNRADPSGI